MPELPEVEIAARNLRAWTAGRRVARLEADPKARYVFRPSAPARFVRALEGVRFGEIRRIGEQLLVTLEKDGVPLGLAASASPTRSSKPTTRRRGAGAPLVSGVYLSGARSA